MPHIRIQAKLEPPRLFAIIFIALGSCLAPSPKTYGSELEAILSKGDPQEAYKELEGFSKGQYEATFSQAMRDVAENQIVATPDIIFKINSVIYQTQYQLVINAMLCYQMSSPGSFDKDICRPILESMEKMETVINNYDPSDDRGLHIQSCLTKARLLDLERNYPPYDYMRIRVQELPKAYNPQAFLECMK